MRRYVIEVLGKREKKARKALEKAGLLLAISASGGETALFVTEPGSASASAALDAAGIPEAERGLHWVDETTGCFGSFGGLESRFGCEAMATLGIQADPKLWKRLAKGAKADPAGAAAAFIGRSDREYETAKEPDMVAYRVVAAAGESEFGKLSEGVRALAEAAEAGAPADWRAIWAERIGGEQAGRLEREIAGALPGLLGEDPQELAPAGEPWQWVFRGSGEMEDLYPIGPMAQIRFEIETDEGRFLGLVGMDGLQIEREESEEEPEAEEE